MLYLSAKMEKSSNPHLAQPLGFILLNHFTKIPKNKILPSVFGAKYLIEYLNEPVKISDNDIIEIVEL